MQLIDRGHFSWEISSRFEYQLWLQSHFNSIPGRHINDKNSIAEGLIDITCPDQYWWLEDTFYPLLMRRERERERFYLWKVKWKVITDQSVITDYRTSIVLFNWKLFHSGQQMLNKNYHAPWYAELTITTSTCHWHRLLTRDCFGTSSLHLRVTWLMLPMQKIRFCSNEKKIVFFPDL